MSDLPTPEQPNIEYKSKKPNILEGLPEFTKDPRNYMTIQKALLETLSCGKLHSDPSSSFTCSKCTENMKTRRSLMKKFGFKSPAQYMQWRRVHEEIKNRMPLDMYNKIIQHE